ncbi:hypothetical protein [Nitrosomonas nitrosa]|uniref:hypothetical protein n=1 Tax=Nitrosomonas nitrosa TaxID=52442 RepID=UPI0023F6A64A|nr:hypothetical protein [Nitrosomonas nitrosa]MCO6433469.1 hypothetical protein [Nitrosomonas nitrosa]
MITTSEKMAVILTENGNVPFGAVFTGRLLAHVSGYHVARMIAVVNGRDESSVQWDELNLYATDSGKYICQRVTGQAGEQDIYQGEALDSEDEVIKFFGNGWLARELLIEASLKS